MITVIGKSKWIHDIHQMQNSTKTLKSSLICVKCFLLDNVTTSSPIASEMSTHEPRTNVQMAKNI